MKLSKLFTDDDAVSPVIGVILMVAITVILAAVIGAFVLGFGGGGPSAPSVTWDTSVTNDTQVSGASEDAVLFEHGGGDTVDDPTTLSISGAGDQNPVLEWDGSANTFDGEVSESDSLTTGDVVGYNASVGGASDASGEYNLIWSSPDSDSTQELASHNA